MCGIVGYKSFSEKDGLSQSLQKAVATLDRRGPDSNGVWEEQGVGLGHTRLSIIDPSPKGNQPMCDPSGRYALSFNGEIYNYRELKKELQGIDFNSTTDTEVLLHLLIKEGVNCLPKLNGFFAFAFYDNQEDTLLIARDRMGIKPLSYYLDDNQLVFGSEMKALLSFDLPKELNPIGLAWYLQLTYLPGNLSMLSGFQKLEPGHYLVVNGSSVEKKAFWSFDSEESIINYQSAQTQFEALLENSVRKRLMADVPLGSFLSGGTDSSAVVALASRHHPNLQTFSIGYRDHPFFDETSYAELVAKKFNTQHQVFSLTNDDLLNDLDTILDYIDEPFADSSAIPTYILSKHVSKYVKVALSGDGADELFGGYYKHQALYQSLQSSFKNNLVRLLQPLVSLLPQSRSNTITNTFRRLSKYADLLRLSPQERYWFLASFTHHPSQYLGTEINNKDFSAIKNDILSGNPDFNDFLDADLKMVLPGDMLTKVDLTSMANSLEVRVPFLDKDVVNFARSLPTYFKVNGSQRKRIVQDTFKEILPPELYNRSKKGFEVPLLQWMRNELLTDLDEYVFNKDYLQDQSVFAIKPVLQLRKRLLSRNPGDVHSTIWALYVFQKWYKRYLES